MAFFDALNLVEWLEGGISQDPRDSGGDTNKGITQRTYDALHQDGWPKSVLAANDSIIATCYRKLWDGCRIANPEAGGEQALFDVLPYPADAVAFQFYINLPPRKFKEIFQRTVGVEADGDLGPITFRATAKFKGDDLAERLLDAQQAHYEEVAEDWDYDGLMNRVDKVRKWALTR